MKKLLIITMSVLGMMLVGASAAELTHSQTIKLDQVDHSYVKKDKAYWTRVWYEKQARKKKRAKRARSSNTYRTRGVLAKVDLSSQTMSFYKGGRLLYKWPVSTGRSGYGTPTGTWRIHRMHKKYYSRKYNNAPMPYAMFYHRGFAVHGTTSISRLGRRASHGCVRLHPKNAARLFSLVKGSGGTVRVTR